MAGKKKTTKKVKDLGAKKLSAAKAKEVRGGGGGGKVRAGWIDKI
jgi:hypothetical protein